jgi:hypothetical protein
MFQKFPMLNSDKHEELIARLHNSLQIYVRKNFKFLTCAVQHKFKRNNALHFKDNFTFNAMSLHVML